MDTELPLISICIPAYNCIDYIKDTIECICGQTYKNLEILVVNDGADVNIKQAVLSFEDSRISIFDIDKGGASRARNYGYKKSSGKYILFFDSDDFLLPNFITTQFRAIENREDIVVFSDWGRFYNDDLSTFRKESVPNGRISFYDWIKIYWQSGQTMTNPGRALIPKNLIEKAGLWDESLSLNDDFEFFSRIFQNCTEIIFNNKSSLFYRSGMNSLSNAKNSEAYQSLYSSIVKSIAVAQESYPNNSEINLGCANMAQLFVYKTYPNCSVLVKKTEKLIRDLGGSNIPFPSGPITKLIATIIGWKNAKQIRTNF
ncbi:glycosyltransferase family 2 protein [Pedobacter sp. MW01-1-1]|uniref:glycosyltransferase family 2 protein n=1 Tax=Pedobacter sp. MW01-1-1 TaxID=3383027 RepID=UPI003FF0C2FF